MSELAFNINGEAFDLPATATAWRVRRMKQRGAPEVVYGKDGVPLVVPIEAGLDELRQVVGVPGRYRLDAIDDRGRTVEQVPASYVIVPAREPAVQTGFPEFRTPEGGAAYVMAEAMRLNTELAKAVVDRFPQMVEAAASLLRAADGAGLPARQPRVIERDEDEDEDDEEDDEDGDEAARPDFYTFLSQVAPVLLAGLGNGSIKMPDLGSILNWGKAAKNGEAARKKVKAEQSQKADGESAQSEPTPTAEDQLMADPVAIQHFIAIMSALAPNEAAMARALAMELGPKERLTWLAELKALSVDSAVARIRTLLAELGKTGGAS